MSLVFEQWLRSRTELDMSTNSTISCVTSGKVFNLSEPCFSNCRREAVVVSTYFMQLL